MSLKDDVLAVLAKTLGPAAGPFLERQCKQRLNKRPEALEKGDLELLIKWVQIGMSLMLDDATGKNLALQLVGLRVLMK